MMEIPRFDCQIVERLEWITQQSRHNQISQRKVICGSDADRESTQLDLPNSRHYIMPPAIKLSAILGVESSTVSSRLEARRSK